MKARSLLKELFLDRYNVVFGVHPNSLEILQTPTDFFSRLQEGISTAKERIYLSTLYTGSEEKNQILANHLNDQLQNNSRLRHKILLDAQRGTRLSKNICSLSLFSESILSNGKKYFFNSPNRIIIF
jgi:phosphatidylserine/phosphatidylglycerophosphate/cardiolipin synthase-like enzyme